MDHSLRSISYIADIGDLLVIMARRRPTVPGDGEDAVQVIGATPKMICHVFESDEVGAGGGGVLFGGEFKHQTATLLRFDSGPVHRAVDRAGFPGGLHGVPEGERHRGPLVRQGDGLPGGAQLAGDLRRRTRHVCQEGAAEGGEPASGQGTMFYFKEVEEIGTSMID